MASIGISELLLLFIVLILWIVPIVLVICAFVILKSVRDDQKKMKLKLEELEQVAAIILQGSFP